MPSWREARFGSPSSHQQDLKFKNFSALGIKAEMKASPAAATFGRIGYWQLFTVAKTVGLLRQEEELPTARRAPYFTSPA